MSVSLRLRAILEALRARRKIIYVVPQTRIMESETFQNIFSIRIDPDGQLVCVIGDDNETEAVGFYPTEEQFNQLRDLIIFLKATSSLEEYENIYQLAKERIDEAWGNRVLREDW